MHTLAKSHGKSSRDSKGIRWILFVFLLTIVISAVMSLVSEEIADGSNVLIAFLILLVIVLIGIVFDIIGVAVTSATDQPFHSMASRKVPGATEAIRLLKNAERVSSICNDVVGDICGVISGSASAAIAIRVTEHFSFTAPKVATLIMSAFVAGLTVGGKAIGKTFAINSCTQIVHSVGKLVYHCNQLFRKGKNKK